MNNCSIIIPHYNGEDILLRCLNSLIQYTENNHEIIIVNNGSSDNSIEIVKKQFSQVKIITNKTNLGYAGACNIGVREAQNEYIIFLNNDTEVSKNWINPLINTLDDINVSSVQPKIKNLNHPDYFDYAGGSGGYMDIFCYPFCRGRIFKTVEKDRSQYESETEIFWASGTAFATKKKIFIAAGMFDLNFFAHMEEIDYHWRCQMMGYKIIANPSSTIYHEGGKTLSYESSKKTYLNHRNSLITFFSNHNAILILALFIPRIIMHFTSTIVDLLSLKINHAFAQIKAIYSVIFSIPHILKKRQLNRKIKKGNYHLYGIFKGSIVINYFLLNKKKYSQY